jgi:hypothetical protein
MSNLNIKNNKNVLKIYLQKNTTDVVLEGTVNNKFVQQVHK